MDQLNRIYSKLAEIRRSGQQPIIIIDEAEYLTIGVFELIKTLYDHVIAYCSIALIGTGDLIRKVEDKLSEKPGIPQFKRRFKAGMRWLPGIDRTFKQLLETFSFEPGLNRLLISMSDNYGELHDFIVPCLREADRLGEPLTENLFRTIRNIPK